MGLRIGGEAPPHHFGVGSIVALHSRNVGDALTKYARYKRLVTPQEIFLEFARVKRGFAFTGCSPRTTGLRC